MIKFDKREFDKVQKIFPNLYFAENENKIRGELDLCARYKDIGHSNIEKWMIEPCDQNVADCIEDFYSIEIDFNKQNSGYPVVLETDNRIRDLAKLLHKSLNDQHLNGDGSCCLDFFLPFDRFSMYDFIMKEVYPYFVWQAYFDQHRKTPPCGEYPHNWKDAIDARIMEEKNNIKLLPAKMGEPTGRDRNKPCRCDSGKKYKNCCFDNDKKLDTEERRIRYLIQCLESIRKKPLKKYTKYDDERNATAA